MLKKDSKGFVIILVVALIGVLILIAWAVVDLGCGEALQVRTRNDKIASSYLATAGVERMYAKLRDLSNNSATVTWPLSISSTNITVDGVVVGKYTASANLSGEADTFMIVADGTFNGRTSRITSKYGYTSTYTNGIPVGSMGAIDMLGQKWWFLKSWVYAEGPVESASTITPNSNTNTRYVQFSGDVTENKTDLSSPSFWVGVKFDTNNSGSSYTDGNGDNSIASTEVTQAQQAEFAADDVNGDGVVDNKDAFTYYYTTYLNNQYNLGIAPGQANYYTGTQTFGPTNVPSGTTIIFVDGDVNVIFNAQKWWGSKSDLTIVATGDITIVQPVNGSDDRLTLISCGDVYTGGINLGDVADVDGNVEMYAGNSFTAILGGSTNGSIFANDGMNIHTGLPSFLFNRDLNQGTDSWSDPTARPIGLPPGYPMVSRPFKIKAENLGASNYKPKWQKR